MNGVRKLREKSGETLNALALRTGIEPSLLSLIERGKHPSLRNAERIAKALKADPRELWTDYETLRKW